MNAHAIGTVGRDRHVEDRVRADVVGISLPQRGVFGQFDDAVVILAQTQLARGTHHAVRFDTANRALAQFHAIGRNHSAGQAQHADQPRARIGRAADDLKRAAIAQIDRQNLKLVGLRVLLRRQHAGDAELLERRRSIGHAFDFQAQRGQLLGNFNGARLGVEQGLEPRKGKLHGRTPTPAERVGTSSAANP